MHQILNPLTFDPPSDIFLNERDNPIDVIKEWFDNAVLAKVLEPGAMALTTLSSQESLSSRTIQVVEINQDGLVFATHARSPKGKDIGDTGKIAGVLYWRELKQQIIVSGYAKPLRPADADRLWSGRPRESCAMSIVTRQSEPMNDEADMKARAATLSASPEHLTRPDSWLGYLIQPTTVEFWEFSPDHLYKRLKYEITRSGWVRTRLQP